MGTKQSVYEKPGTLDYYKFNAEEYALVKKVWSGIEINPQFHGSACFRSFCERYPQYVKFFTQESKLHLSFDTRVTAKFTNIMEAIGYLLLDFNKKPKQLDRLVGYIAMVHKDMRLVEQDMHNLVTSLFEYLSRMYPAYMTAHCQQAMSKFMDSVIKELFVKMKTFRDYDVAQSSEVNAVVRSKSPWGRYSLFGEPLIFGKTKLYWDEWKKQWNARLDEWEIQAASAVQELISFTNNETLKSRIDLSNENRFVGVLQRKVSELIPKQEDFDASSSLALLTLSKTIESSPNQTRKQTNQQCRKRRVSTVRLPHGHPEGASTPRERYRIESSFRNISKPRPDGTILRMTSQLLDHPALGKTILSKDQGNHEKMIEQQKCESSEIAEYPKSHNTARERRRDRFNVDLK
ncbi:uncharacterized protein LOC114941551 [Nylanderia fulva]|uniref:uncharacterized protein LOC114941551 n=1 Tax=Nylanderia fulva TaxID=613905 RepID=UPI0010FBB34C|nr:uncharacterized protein LOC114941551 [Nylanderia fulva]